MKSLLEAMRDKCKKHDDCEYRDDKHSFPYTYECEDCMMRCSLTAGDIETTEKESKKMKTKYIIEYKLKGEPDKWRYYHAAGNEDKAWELMEEAKRLEGAFEVRMRAKVEQSHIVEEWKKDGNG